MNGTDYNNRSINYDVDYNQPAISPPPFFSLFPSLSCSREEEEEEEGEEEEEVPPTAFLHSLWRSARTQITLMFINRINISADT